MKFAIGGDSTPYITKSITEYLEEKGIDLIKCGALKGEDADYVDSAHEVSEKVASGEADYGLLFCNTGTGVTIIANKVPGVRAALCIDNYSAKISKLANNANVLVLSMRYTGEGLAKEIVDTWLETEPSTEERRMNFHRKTDEIDAKYKLCQ
ncbi:MAG: RpiB/LacA/LacB family sugar-phosphate isomerase [Verrucomicrobia bacterium]|nr:RpiB/LacA/LacB family sugar-phosphate isomerase [Verrucomicrobiota bacterium]